MRNWLQAATWRFALKLRRRYLLDDEISVFEVDRVEGTDRTTRMAVLRRAVELVRSTDGEAKAVMTAYCQNVLVRNGPATVRPRAIPGVQGVLLTFPQGSQVHVNWVAVVLVWAAYFNRAKLVGTPAAAAGPDEVAFEASQRLARTFRDWPDWMEYLQPLQP